MSVLFMFSIHGNDEGTHPSDTRLLSPARRSRKIIRGLKEGLTEEDRFAVADHTVAQQKAAW